MQRSGCGALRQRTKRYLCNYANGKQRVGRTTFYTGNLTELVQRLKAESGKDMYCDGGAEIVNELLKYDLIDELIISVIPILLGNGTSLFKAGRPEQRLELVSAKSYDTGLVQLHYKRVNL